MKTLKDSLLKVEIALSRRWGAFGLFALFLRENAMDRWDLIVSAPWAQADEWKALKRISTRLRQELSVDDLVLLSRVVIVPETHPEVVALNRTVQTEHAAIEVQDREFFGMHMRHAVIFASKSPASHHARARHPTATSHNRRHVAT